MDFVQSKFQQDDGPATVINAIFPGDVTAGSLMVAVFRTSNNRTMTVESAGDSWTRDQRLQSEHTNFFLEVWSAPNATGGAKTVTGTASANDALRFAILEFSGIATSDVLHEINSDSDTSDAANGGPLTTSIADTLVVHAIADDSGEIKNPSTPTAGFTLVAWTEEPPDDPDKIDVEYKLDAGIATYNGTYVTTTWTSETTWAAVMVAYKESANGGGNGGSEGGFASMGMGLD